MLSMRSSHACMVQESHGRQHAIDNSVSAPDDLRCAGIIGILVLPHPDEAREPADGVLL